MEPERDNGALMDADALALTASMQPHIFRLNTMNNSISQGFMSDQPAVAQARAGHGLDENFRWHRIRRLAKKD